MEIVSEAADFFRLLFTPCMLHLDEDHDIRKQFKKYLNANKEFTKEEDQWMRKVQMLTWETFDSLTGKLDWSMFAPTLLKKLDDLNKQ